MVPETKATIKFIPSIALTFKSLQMQKIEIVTNSTVGQRIENVLASPILSKGWTIKLESIKYEKGLASTYATATIIQKDPNVSINPSDLFFLGFYAAS